jgi:hypothetical protein
MFVIFLKKGKAMRALRIAVLLGLIFTAGFTQAQETIWVGGDGKWTDGNWDNGQPGDNYDVVINNPIQTGTVIYDDTENYLYSGLSVDNGNTLEHTYGEDLTVSMSTPGMEINTRRRNARCDFLSANTRTASSAWTKKNGRSSSS